MPHEHPEAGRIALLVERDGREAALRWVRNIVRTYRQAVLNKRHFASTPYYRPRFIAAYCDFKRWLSGQGSLERRDRRAADGSTRAPRTGASA